MSDRTAKPQTNEPHEAAPASDAVSRRRVLTTGAVSLAATALAGAVTRSAQAAGAPAPSAAPGLPGRDYQPVVVPNGAKLPWKIVDGVKVFHLVAEEVEHEYAPGIKAQCWGYNGHVPGPTIE